MTAVLLPEGRQTFTTAAGVPLVGGKLYTYDTGTSNPRTTWSDAAQTAPNTNPIILDAVGAATIFWSGSYKVLLTDSTGATMPGWPVDNISQDTTSADQLRADLANTNTLGKGNTLISYGQIYAARYGAPTTGLTSANAGIAAADTAAQAAGTGFVLSAGTYLIDSNLTITSDIRMEPGAQFKIATGITLRILGNIYSHPQQIFNQVGTGVVAFGNTVLNQKWGVGRTNVCPEFWGAKGMTGPNAATTGDTVAVQACFDSHREFVFYQHYPVTQVIISSNEVTGDFGGFELRANATVATKSVLDLKCGYSSIKRIQASGEFNYRYECAIHWYTNDLNSYYPGQNRFYGLWARNALIGVCIGALPSQADPIPAQGTVNAAGVASNAPLSESTAYGFQTFDCVIGVYYRQPNGKITIQGNVTGSATNWTGLFGTSGYTAASTCALVMGHEGNELTLVGGSLENVNNQTGTLMQIGGGTLNLIGVTIETIAPSFIGHGTSGTASDARVNIVNSNDFGFNFPAVYQAFNIDKNCVGQLSISNCFLSYPNGSLTAFQHPAFYAVDGFGGAFSPNFGKFQVKLSNVELNDVPFVQGAAYGPLAQGVDLMVNGATLASYTAGVRASSQYLSDDTSNLLSGQVDTSNYLITAYGLNGNAASGGWTFTVTNAGTCNWGSTASGITYFGKTLDKALRLSAPAGQSTTATTTNKISLQAQKTYLLRGFVKTGASAATCYIRALWWKWDNTAASTAQTDLYVAPESGLGATTQQLLLTMTPPKDAVKFSLFIAADNGSDITVTDLSIT